LKIVVVNGFITEAIGDAALLSVLLEQLSTIFPEAQILVTSLDDPSRHPDFEGYRNLGSSRRYGADESVARYRRAFRKLAVALIGSYWPTKPGAHRSGLDRLLPSEVRRELEALRGADLVVSVGGGYLNGLSNLSGDLSVFNMCMPLRYAGRIGKPLFCAPQSYGPFGTSRQLASARRALGKVDLLLAREAKSVRLLEASGIRAASVIQTIDPAFAFKTGNPAGWRARLNVPDSRLLIGFTARQWRKPFLQAPQEAAFAQLIDYIQADANRAVVLIPMVVSELAGEDDREVHRRIADRCTGSRPILVEENLSYREVKDLTSSLDFMIGMRFHSVIFSLTNLVPSIAIEYHHKASGIMGDLGLEEWVVQFDDLSVPQLVGLFDRLLTEASGYREHLRQTIPRFIKTADGVKDLMKKAYEAKMASY
jgi:colanic acid/amylovoran biosynthesis protein